MASSVDMVLLRLVGDSEEASSGSRRLFLVTLLAVLKTCFATFSSVNIAWIAVMEDFASESELDQKSDHLNVGPDLERLLLPCKVGALKVLNLAHGHWKRHFRILGEKS